MPRAPSSHLAGNDDNTNTMRHAALFTLLLPLGALAQNVTRDADGNFTEIQHDSTTTFTLTATRWATGEVETLPVYKSPKGKLYAWKTNKKGRKYRFYLQPEPKTEKP
mgnify:CR=1 FL=1